jgi:predicted nucleotidyltransferase
MNNTTIALEDIFSTKERIKILSKIIFLEEEFGVNQIAKDLELSKGLISNYFNLLVKEGILSRKGIKFVVENNSKVKGIKIILNILKADISLFKKYKFVKAVGLYGSCAKGTNTKNSDVDLWVKTDKTSEDNLIKLSSELRKNVENIKILILDNKKIEHLKKEDVLFYHSLFFGSIILYGDENEI